MKHRLERTIGRTEEIAANGAPPDAPRVAATTYGQTSNEWYPPLMAGAGSFSTMVAGAPAVRSALAVLDRLTPDKYSEFLSSFYRDGLERFGDNWHYADINTVLIGLSEVMKVERYMEIGVRRGRSMAMVVSRSPQCRILGFDLWLQNYAGMENPGKEFVSGELRRMSYSGNVSFVDGDSRVTVPRYFAKNPDSFFDIITVDGDHTAEGATLDLTNVIPRLKIGGALVFDDISHPSHLALTKVWREVVEDDPRFSTYSFRDVGFGVGFAIRKF